MLFKHIVRKAIDIKVHLMKIKEKVGKVAEIPLRTVKSIINSKPDSDIVFQYKIGIVAIIKNEEQYIEEWVKYHLFIGVEKIYLFNNGSTDNTRQVLNKYLEIGLVEIIDFPGTGMQKPAYNYAIDKYKFECQYIAFIDADEFLFMYDRETSLYNTVTNILSKNKHAAGIAVNWRIFGSSGLEKKPEGGVLRNFLYRAEECGKGNVCIKSIVNPRKVYKFGHVHYPEYYYGYYSIDENGNRVDGWENAVDKTNIIRINHYFTKSKEEWISRRSLGKADAKSAEKRTMDEFYAHDNNDIYDDAMLYYVSKIDSKCFKR